MITALEVENFRGLRHLKVEDLGRVNLIIGRNDCGKTSLAAAAMACSSMNGLDTAAKALSSDMAEHPDQTDFDARWRRLFHGGDDVRGFSVRATRASGAHTVRVARAADRPVLDQGWPRDVALGALDVGAEIRG